MRTLLEGAFGGTAEADLVGGLRSSGDVVLLLVAARPDGTLVGCVAFPRLSVESASRHTDRRSDPAVALAPLAVAADLRRRGIGAALVRRGLALLAERGEQLVFVLGDPAYYARFGFDSGAAGSFQSPYAGSHFMALRLTRSAPMNGIVRYPSAFTPLG